MKLVYTREQFGLPEKPVFQKIECENKVFSQGGCTSCWSCPECGRTGRDNLYWLDPNVVTILKSKCINNGDVAKRCTRTP